MVRLSNKNWLKGYVVSGQFESGQKYELIFWNLVLGPEKLHPSIEYLANNYSFILRQVHETAYNKRYAVLS